MRSSTGQHFPALDHARAIAAFLVIGWHVTSSVLPAAEPVPWILGPIVEGHTGVALFMVLSGYLFALILDNRAFSVPLFLYNRALRLLPLLTVALLLSALVTWSRGESLGDYALALVKGVVLPTLPRGGWSLTVEFHFYLLLPLLLAVTNRVAWAPIVLIALAVAVRALIYAKLGSVQDAGYWTLIGRIDQFLAGMVFARYRHLFARRHGLAFAVAAAFALFLGWFHGAGGFYGFGGAYPSPSTLWIVLPTIEAFVYATLLAYYETTAKTTGSPFAALLERAGTFSYSIYLLSFFVVPRSTAFVDRTVIDLSSTGLALAWTAIMMLVMILVGALSYSAIESPFLRLRRPYLMEVPVSEADDGEAKHRSLQARRSSHS